MNADLTPGMLEVLRAYLAPFEPAHDFDDNLDQLLSTDIIIADIGDAVDLPLNAVADYMVEQGFRYHCLHSDGISGWILRPRRRPRS